MMDVFNDEEDEFEIDEEVLAYYRRPREFGDRRNFIEIYDEVDFKSRFRLSKISFINVLNLIGHYLALPSNRNNPITATTKLYLTLRFLATGSLLLAVADFTGVSQSSASRFVKQVCRAIASQRGQFFNLSCTQNGLRVTRLGFYNLARFPKVTGVIDCTQVKIQSPGGDRAEDFRNRKGYFSINVQCICNSELKIMDIVAHWPGATHDQHVFNNSRVKQKLEDLELDGYLLGDGGYELKPYLMTPLRNPGTRAEQLYNESHIRTRNVIERCFGVLKRRFPFLSKLGDMPATGNCATSNCCMCIVQFCTTFAQKMETI